MSDNNQSLRSLIEKVVNDIATEEEHKELEQRLLDDHKAREFYQDYINIHSALRNQYLAGDDIISLEEESELVFEQAQEADKKPEKQKPVLMVIVAVAAAILLAFVSMNILVNNPVNNNSDNVLAVNDLPVVINADNGFFLSGKDGMSKSIRSGLTLKNGDYIHSEVEGKALTLRYKDGTQVKLLGSVKLQIKSHDSKQLFLEQGVISADVVTQKAGTPMIIATSHAKVNVIGTSFELSADPLKGIQLELIEGKIELEEKDKKPQFIKEKTITYVIPERETKSISLDKLLRSPDREYDIRGIKHAAFSNDGKTIIAINKGKLSYIDPSDIVTIRPYIDSKIDKFSFKVAHGPNFVYWHRLEKRLYIKNADLQDDKKYFDNLSLLAKKADNLNHKKAISIPALSPYADKMVSRWTENRTRSFNVIDLKSNQVLWDYTVPKGWLSSYLFSRDGNMLAVSNSNIGNDKYNNVLVFDSNNGKSTVLPIKKSHKYLAMDFSSDNRLLAIGLKGEIQIWNIDAQEMIHRIEDIGNDISSVCFSPDGAQLAAKGRMQNIKIYKLSHLDEQAIFIETERTIDTVLFSPDGKSLVGYGENLAIWKLN